MLYYSPKERREGRGGEGRGGDCTHIPSGVGFFFAPPLLMLGGWEGRGGAGRFGLMDCLVELVGVAVGGASSGFLVSVGLLSSGLTGEGSSPLSLAFSATGTAVGTGVISPSGTFLLPRGGLLGGFSSSFLSLSSSSFSFLAFLTGLASGVPPTVLLLSFPVCLATGTGRGGACALGAGTGCVAMATDGGGGLGGA